MDSIDWDALRGVGLGAEMRRALTARDWPAGHGAARVTEVQRERVLADDGHEQRPRQPGTGPEVTINACGRV